MIVKGDADIQKLRIIGGIVARCLKYMMGQAKPGMTLKQLDDLGGAFLTREGARSAPIAMYDFPGHTCLSIAPVVAHGVPNDTVLKMGDLLNIDVSAEKDGYFGDTGGSFYIGATPADDLLLRATREALNEAMKVAKAGAKINEIGRAIEIVANRYDLEIIENLGSHGIGKSLHEEPKFIPAYFDPDDQRTFKKGQVITIEPFLSTQSCFVDELEDGWSLVADEGGLAAQFEHTMVITDGHPLILTESDPL